MKSSRLVDLHHRWFFQPLTPHDHVVEAVRCLLVGIAVGCVLVWAWTS